MARAAMAPRSRCATRASPQKLTQTCSEWVQKADILTNPLSTIPSTTQSVLTNPRLTIPLASADLDETSFDDFVLGCLLSDPRGASAKACASRCRWARPVHGGRRRPLPFPSECMFLGVVLSRHLVSHRTP